MKPVIFVFCVDNAIDLITNSSSELFVFKGDTKKQVSGMIRKVYNNYLREYESLKSIRELNLNELNWYISMHYGRHGNSHLVVLPGFTEDEMYEKIERDWRPGGYDVYAKDATEENQEKYIQAIDPDGKLYFMFSKDDNPDWELQEKLMEIGSRYHMG